MVGSNEDRGMRRRPDVEDQGWPSTDQVLGDAVCCLHYARGDEECGFLGFGLKTQVDGLSVVWPQIHWDGFFRFGLKTGGYGLSVVWPQNHCDGFLIWDSKSVATVW
jgi:hypothetical protein